MTAKPLSAEAYDGQWEVCRDFVHFHPGARHRRRLILQLMAKVSFSEVLDVGCGSGELLMNIRARFGEQLKLRGADFSADAIQENRKRYPNVEFFVHDLTSAATPPQGEMVVCSEVIEHLADPYLALERLALAVRPGGHLLLTCPLGTVHATEKHFGHVAHPDLAKLLERGARAGLKVVQRVRWGFPVYTLQKWATNRNPEWALSKFTGEYGLSQRFVSHALYAANFLNLPDSSRGCQLVALLKKTP